MNSLLSDHFCQTTLNLISGFKENIFQLSIATLSYPYGEHAWADPEKDKGSVSHPCKIKVAIRIVGYSVIDPPRCNLTLQICVSREVGTDLSEIR